MTGAIGDGRDGEEGPATIPIELPPRTSIAIHLRHCFAGVKLRFEYWAADVDLGSDDGRMVLRTADGGTLRISASSGGVPVPLPRDLSAAGPVAASGTS